MRNRGDFHAYRGEFDRAVEAYRQAAVAPGVEPGVNETWHGGVGSAAFHALAELRALRGDDKGARAEAERALALQPKSLRALYVAGAQASRRRDTSGADRYLATLRETLASAASSLGGLYADALAAEIALARGRAAEARPLFERVVNSGKLLSDYWVYFASAGPAFRDGLARTYLALGDKQQAAAALERLLSSGYERVHHPVLYVRALYPLGKLKLELGDTARGRELLKQFLDHWSKADWDLAEVRDARRMLSGS